jgi:ribosomal protein L29
MKIQIKKELHTKSVGELTKQLKDARNEKRIMQLDREMGKLKNTSSLSSKRVEIAVISTIINEKLIEAKLEKVNQPEEKKEVSTKAKPAAKKAMAKSASKQTASVKTSAGKGGKNE